MKTILSLAILLAAAAASSAAESGKAAPGPVEPYVSFLRAEARDPVEYFTGLFEKCDVVVFTEGLHPELGQYEFLAKVVRSPRFLSRVGGVFTEIGSVSQQPVMDRFILAKDLNEEPLIRINRENTFHPQGWRNNNILDFWKALWEANAGLAEGEKVRAYLSDMPWVWEDIKTSEDYQRALRAAEHRDRIMADRIVKEIEAGAGARRKFLVVMNTRHGLGLARNADNGEYGENVGTLLKLKWQDKVCNVLYHQKIAAPAGSAYIQETYGIRNYNPIRGGLWDAAFYANGDKPAGFSLEGSPFGLDKFDYHERFRAENYQSVFDGLIFYAPVPDMETEAFIEGFFSDPAYVEETRRRAAVAGRQWYDPALLQEYGKRGYVFSGANRENLLKFIKGIVKPDGFPE